VIDFGLKVARNEAVTEKDFSRLAEHGLDSEDAWDIAAFASLTTLINRMATFLDAKPNQEFYTMGRERAKL